MIKQTLKKTADISRNLEKKGRPLARNFTAGLLKETGNMTLGALGFAGKGLQKADNSVVKKIGGAMERGEVKGKAGIQKHIGKYADTKSGAVGKFATVAIPVGGIAGKAISMLPKAKKAVTATKAMPTPKPPAPRPPAPPAPKPPAPKPPAPKPNKFNSVSNPLLREDLRKMNIPTASSRGRNLLTEMKKIDPDKIKDPTISTVFKQMRNKKSASRKELFSLIDAINKK